MRDLEGGKKLHREAVAAGLHSHKFVAAALITMYSKCRSMAFAQQVFDGMVDLDIVSWNSIILGYVQNGQSSIAMDLFTGMNCAPSSVTCVAALKACGSLATEKESDKKKFLHKGIFLHKQAKDRGFESDKFVASTLVDMYSKCGSMDSAREVFDRMVCKDVVAWNALIMGYVQNGKNLVAMDLFTSMDCRPSSITYVAVLQACGGLGVAAEKQSEKQICLEKGISIHRQAREFGFDSETIVANSLVHMYSKCGSLDRARGVFDRMASKDVVTWTTLMLGYVHNGQSSQALELFAAMDCAANCVTYIAALKACGARASEKESDKQIRLERGAAIHKQARDRGYESDIILSSTLVDMYSKCGSMNRAKGVFDGMVLKNAVTWNSLILGYVQNGENLVAIDLFFRMDCEPSSVTYVAALKACGSLATEKESDKRFCLEKGIAIHKQAKDCGFDSDIVVATSLVNMYSKCGSMDQAKQVFDGMVFKSVVTWNSLMLGYVQHGENLVALDLFSTMDCQPDSLSYVAALKACRHLATESEKQSYLRKGIAIHKQAKDHGFDSEGAVASTLVSMYSKCGSMDRGREVFDRMAFKGVITWTSLILGYVQNGENSMAMDLFMSMDCEADSFTYVAALKACGNLAAVSTGRQIHARICRLGLEQDQVVRSSLMDLYGKDGGMSIAEELFNGMENPDVVSWNTLMTGYSSIGDSTRVFNLAKGMQEAGLQMDGITFICVLTVCSHAGFVEKGKLYFERMLSCGITPSVEHYNCMVDLLGRANRLQEALDFVNNIPAERINAVTWRSLLGACRKWKNSEVGKVAFDALVATSTTEASPYLMMSDIWRNLEHVDVERIKAKQGY